MRIRIMVGLIALLVALTSCNNAVTVPQEEFALESIEDVTGSRFAKSYISRSQLLAYAEKYRKNYIKHIDKNGIEGYYVAMKGEGGPETAPHYSTSEAMGYGMRLAIQGYKMSTNSTDRNKWKNTFNGLWRVISEFSSRKGGFKWIIPKTMDPDDYGTNSEGEKYMIPCSATDGDLDIIYALIMANKVFGSNSTSGHIYNYKQKALQRLFFLKNSIVVTRRAGGKEYSYIPVGDWATSAYTDEETGKRVNIDRVSRPADWTLHHFRTYVKFLNEIGASKYSTNYQKLIDGTEALFQKNIFGHGILPDFIYFDEQKGIIPLKLNSIEAQELGEAVSTEHMSWNACRVPWRVAMDFKVTPNRINYNTLSLLRNKLYTGAARSNLKNTGVKYSLSGQLLQDDDYSTAFASPIATTIISFRPTSAGAGRYYRKILNRSQNFLINEFVGAGSNPNEIHDGYFGDSINFFCMMLLSDHQYIPYK